jgi:chromosome segregation ATPase
MPPDDRNPVADPLREFDTQLASLRAAARSFRQQKPSWFESIFHPGRQARRQADFSAAVVASLKEIAGSIRNVTAKLEEGDRQFSGLRSEIDRLRGNEERAARESTGTIKELADRAAEMRQQFEQLLREQSERLAQLAAGQGDLGNELRERIQHVLDEQRVAVRQLSLKASEDAILSDRARRTTELKLEELGKRLPPKRA